VRPLRRSSLKRLPEIHEIDVCQHSSQYYQYDRTDEARGDLLDNQEGYDDGHQNKNIITDILHNQNIFLKAVGKGVSNSIGSPVTG
jgi:hypothetical protein